MRRKNQKNIVEELAKLFKRLFKGKNTAKTKPAKSSGITIIPKGLKPIPLPLFKNFDKVKFYKKLKAKYPKNADTIYRMSALESSHFKSGQFLYTGSAGMEVHKEDFPYGWTSAKNIWKNKDLAPIGYKVFTDGAKRRRAFLAFKTPMSFAAYLNAYIDKYGAGRWRSTNPEKQKSYVAYINKINLPV